MWPFRNTFVHQAPPAVVGNPGYPMVNPRYPYGYRNPSTGTVVVITLVSLAALGGIGYYVWKQRQAKNGNGATGPSTLEYNGWTIKVTPLAGGQASWEVWETWTLPPVGQSQRSGKGTSTSVAQATVDAKVYVDAQMVPAAA